MGSLALSSSMGTPARTCLVSLGISSSLPSSRLTPPTTKRLLSSLCPTANTSASRRSRAASSASSIRSSVASTFASLLSHYFEPTAQAQEGWSASPSLSHTHICAERDPRGHRVPPPDRRQAHPRPTG